MITLASFEGKIRRAAIAIGALIAVATDTAIARAALAALCNPCGRANCMLFLISIPAALQRRAPHWSTMIAASQAKRAAWRYQA